jgi:hypothetical protein
VRVGAPEDLRVLCVPVSSEMPFRELVARVDRAVRATDGLGSVPAGDVVRRAGLSVEPSRSPFSDVLFGWPSAPEPLPRFGTAGVERIHARDATTRADLALLVDTTQPRVTGRLEYATARWEAVSARLAGGAGTCA